MDEKTKATLANLDTWKRGVFMLVFAIISGVTKLIVTLVAIFQFVTLLFKGQVNATMQPFGQNLSTYQYQITLFLTFKTDEMPFPFIDFPDGTPESALNNGDEESTTTADPTAKNAEKIVDTEYEDIQDETKVQKDTKGAPSKE